MPIDWDDEPPPIEPDFIKPQNVVEIRTMDDAIKLLDQWQAAEAETWRMYVRLHSDYIAMKERAEYAESLALTLEHIYRIMAKPENERAFEGYVAALRHG